MNIFFSRIFFCYFPPTNISNIYRYAMVFSLTDNIFLTECTEFFYSRTRCLTSSNALYGTHENAVAAPACHAELVSPTNFMNFTNIYCCAMGLSPTDCTDLKDFYLPELTIRFFAASNALCGFTQIFIAARWVYRYSRGVRTLRCSRFCYSCF